MDLWLSVRFEATIHSGDMDRGSGPCCRRTPRQLFGLHAWIDVIHLAWFALTVVSVAWIALDVFRNTLENRIINWF